MHYEFYFVKLSVLFSADRTVQLYNMSKVVKKSMANYHQLVVLRLDGTDECTLFAQSDSLCIFRRDLYSKRYIMENQKASYMDQLRFSDFYLIIL